MERKNDTRADSRTYSRHQWVVMMEEEYCEYCDKYVDDPCDGFDDFCENIEWYEDDLDD